MPCCPSLQPAGDGQRTALKPSRIAVTDDFDVPQECWAADEDRPTATNSGHKPASAGHARKPGEGEHGGGLKLVAWCFALMHSAPVLQRYALEDGYQQCVRKRMNAWRGLFKLHGCRSELPAGAYAVNSCSCCLGPFLHNSKTSRIRGFDLLAAVKTTADAEADC